MRHFPANQLAGVTALQQHPVDRHLDAFAIGKRAQILQVVRVARRHRDQMPALRPRQPQPRRDILGHIADRGQQCGHPPHRFGGDALLILGRDHPRQRVEMLRRGFGQDHLQHAQPVHPRHGGVGIGQAQQRGELGCDPLAAEALERRGEFGAGHFGVFVKFRPEPRLEAEVAQDPQMILADPVVRIADEAHAARRKIVQPAEIVRDLQRLGMGIERVDGEIAPGRILFPALGECHGCAAPVCRDIAPQCGDLDWPACEDRGHGAVLDAGRHGADPCGAAQFDDLFGQQPGRTVDIVDRDPQQAVADCPADPADVVRSQRRCERAQPIAPGPGGIGQASEHRPVPRAQSGAPDWR